MWSVGRYDLRLSEEEFWKLTPAQYGALLERHKEHEEWQDWRAGVIASTVANALGATKRQLAPADFMPGRHPKKRQTPEEQLAILQTAWGNGGQ